MSAFGLKPQFADPAGYRSWCRQWRSVQAQLSQDIRAGKHQLKHLARTGHPSMASRHKALHYQRVMGHKLMTLLDEAKQRYARIRSMQTQLAAQYEKFPLGLADCRVCDFHFNRISMEFPWMPAWVIKAKGQSFYVDHVTCGAGVGWTTRELAEGSTRGTLRFRNVAVHIDAAGEAEIVSTKALQDL